MRVTPTTTLVSRSKSMYASMPLILQKRRRSDVTAHERNIGTKPHKVALCISRSSTGDPKH